MKMVVEGVMNGNLPWGLVIVGICIAVVVEILGIPVLPFAIGLYLPIYLTVPIMIGGLIRLSWRNAALPMRVPAKPSVITVSFSPPV